MIRSVLFTGDWHTTSEEDMHRIDALLPKTVPLILIGDLIDVGIDRGMQWNQENVTRQVKYLQEILSKRRVLGYVLGNHEDRIVRLTGLNPYYSFLGEPQSEYELVYKNIKANVRYENDYDLIRKIVVEHGTRNIQNPLAQLRTFGLIHPEADVVVLGHDHSLGFWRDGKQWLVRSGHLQEYPEYARKAILPKKVMGYIKYNLKNNKLEVILA
jgi:predicted phosphodiesterase